MRIHKNHIAIFKHIITVSYHLKLSKVKSKVWKKNHRKDIRIFLECKRSLKFIAEPRFYIVVGTNVIKHKEQKKYKCNCINLHSYFPVNFRKSDFLKVKTRFCDI